MFASVIQGRERDLGDGFAVRRVLPVAHRRQLGPFVFLDHFGPLDVRPEQLTVRPHPHIGLATLTWLLAGAVTHRDSLGSHVVIRPGAVNWMSAGRGVVHSERNEAYAGPLEGLQLWVALPVGLEDGEPSFQHVPAEQIPARVGDGARARLVVGAWWGARSPVRVASDTLFVDVELSAAGRFSAPRAHAELGVFVVSGSIEAGGARLDAGSLGVLEPDASIELASAGGARVVLVGGEPVGPRHMLWNFVHSDRARVEAARDDWRDGRFPEVPGDAGPPVPFP